MSLLANGDCKAISGELMVIVSHAKPGVQCSGTRPLTFYTNFSFFFFPGGPPTQTRSEEVLKLPHDRFVHFRVTNVGVKTRNL